MELIEQILSQSNLKEAICRVEINKGAPGVDKKQLMNLIAISRSIKQKSKMQS